MPSQNGMTFESMGVLTFRSYIHWWLSGKCAWFPWCVCVCVCADGGAPGGDGGGEDIQHPDRAEQDRPGP